MASAGFVPCTAVVYVELVNRSIAVCMSERCQILLSLRFRVHSASLAHPSLQAALELSRTLERRLETGPECCKLFLRHATTNIVLPHLISVFNYLSGLPLRSEDYDSD